MSEQKSFKEWWNEELSKPPRPIEIITTPELNKAWDDLISEYCKTRDFIIEKSKITPPAPDPVDW